MKNLLSIFSELFRISLFVIGGGYSILVVADRRFAKLGWTSEGEIIDHLPVFQTIPGLIATHTAVYVGRKRGGIPGAVVGVIAVAIPAVAIFTGVSACYELIPLGNPWLGSAFIGLRAALTGIIAATIIRSWRKSLPDAFAYSLMLAGVLAIGYFHIHVAAVLAVAMAVGLMFEGAVRRPQPQLSSSESTKKFNSSLIPLLLFAQYGALCFGGGFVLVPMYLNDFIGEAAPYLNIAESEFGDIMALSQMTPGPIGVNCATFFGYRIAGVAGAVAASAMLLLPGSVLAYAALSSLEKFRTSRTVQGIMRGIRPASIALMLVALFVFAKMTVLADNVFRPWGLVLLIIATVLTMNKKINVILLIILCALTGSALRADVTAKDYPDADTVVIDDREDIEYFPDGTYRSVEESWVKAMTEAGRRELGSDSCHFSRRYGDAKFAAVAIISEDGTRRDLDLKGLVKEASDNSSNSSNIYDPLDRRIVCNIPGVKVGDTVYVRKERSTFAARCQNQWSTLSVSEQFSPVLRSSLRIRCPKERPLRSTAVRNPLGNTVFSAVTNTDGSVVMEWCATNSPQAFPEPAMPSAYKQLQHVVVSTAADWRELSKWYWELCAPHLAKTNAAMIAKVEELKTKADGRRELLAEVFRFVSQEIRYMGLTMEDKSPGYAPHDVDITFDKRYGVCRDKAGLLAAMLRLAGFDAYPVLIMAGSAKMDPVVPSPYFNHAIVAVDASKDKQLLNSSLFTLPSSLPSYVLLDPTDESTRDFLPSYESDCSYLVARPEGETLLTTPMPPADKNLLKIDSTADLEGNGSMLIESSIAFRGLNDTVFRRRFLSRKPSERREMFEDIVSAAYPGARLLKYELKPENLQDVSIPLTAKLSAKAPEVLLRGESEIRFSTGWLSRSIGIANMLLSGRTALEKRRFPLRLASTAGIEETLKVKLCDALGDTVAIPEQLDIVGPYEYHLSAVVTNGEYLLSRKVKVNSLEFSPEEYLDLRENIKTVEAAGRKRSVFEINRLGNADVHYLFRGTSYDFSGDCSWVSTNTVVKKILTYDGKKNNSEETFNYNPLIGGVKIVRASVTGPDGKTVFAGDKEVTELDSQWVASAQRYPASKKLVLTLPSVEIGSIITTVVETVVRDSPCAFRRRLALDVVEPTDQLVYRFDRDVRRVMNPVRVPDEECQPTWYRWRKNFTVDRGTIAATCVFLRRAAEVDSLNPSILNLQPQPSTSSLKAIRDWMTKHVRVIGPSLYELPLEKQLTDPAVVVKERYATRLDYIRTLCALLKGAGFKADIVFASRLIGNDERFPKAYTEAVCRVGGLFLGTENEYTPLEATAEDDYWYLDPVTEKEDVIHAKGAEMRDSDEDLTTITVRPNGAVDYDYECLLRGAQVGGFRKLYEEMLPEERSRHYQGLLGHVAQSASATSDLVTDTKSYPAKRAYSCYIPDFAVVQGDTISLEVPKLFVGFPLTGEVRRSPVGLGHNHLETERWKIIFPEGYTSVEKLPEPISVHNPMKPEEIWWEMSVSSSVVNGHLEVEVVKKSFECDYSVVPREYFQLLRDWFRRGTAPSVRTITVRR